MSRTLGSFVVAVALVVSAHSAGAADPKPPEGQWTVQLKPSPKNTLKGTTEGYTDTITIQEGKFVTEVNAKYGFEPVACSVKTAKGKTLVVAQLADEKHGKTEYQLTFSGKEVVGLMRWGKQGEDGKPKYAEYSLTGAKK